MTKSFKILIFEWDTEPNKTIWRKTENEQILQVYTEETIEIQDTEMLRQQEDQIIEMITRRKINTNLLKPLPKGKVRDTIPDPRGNGICIASTSHIGHPQAKEPTLEQEYIYD